MFANSSAETIEAAIKLARARTGRHVTVSVAKGFHGKTLGALSATHKVEYQKPFGDLDALDARLTRTRQNVWYAVK